MKNRSNHYPDYLKKNYIQHDFEIHVLDDGISEHGLPKILNSLELRDPKIKTKTMKLSEYNDMVIENGKPRIQKMILIAAKLNQYYLKLKPLKNETGYVILDKDKDIYEHYIPLTLNAVNRMRNNILAGNKIEKKNQPSQENTEIHDADIDKILDELCSDIKIPENFDFSETDPIPSFDENLLELESNLDFSNWDLDPGNTSTENINKEINTPHLSTGLDFCLTNVFSIEQNNDLIIYVIDPEKILNKEDAYKNGMPIIVPPNSINDFYTKTMTISEYNKLLIINKVPSSKRKTIIAVAAEQSKNRLKPSVNENGYIVYDASKHGSYLTVSMNAFEKKMERTRKRTPEQMAQTEARPLDKVTKKINNLFGFFNTGHDKTTVLLEAGFSDNYNSPRAAKKGKHEI